MGRALGAGFYRACWFALTALVLVLLASTVDSRAWPLELLSHFVVQYLLAAFVLCLVFTAMGRRGSAIAAFIVALAFAADYQQAPQPLGEMTLAPVTPALASVGQETGLPSHRLTLITANLSVLNQRRDEVGTWLATRPAEVVVLQEASPRMTSMLRSLRDIYRYQLFIEPGARLNSEIYGGTEALAVLSTHPIVERVAVRPSKQDKLALLARLSVAGAGDPWIVVVHPKHPVNARFQAARDTYLSDLAPVVASLDGPVIVAGDFNVTPYAPAFGDFVRTSRTSTFRDFPSTFPARLGPLGIPIDHVLVRDARITDLEALPTIGSDHRFLKAALLLPVFAEERKYAGRP